MANPKDLQFNDGHSWEHKGSPSAFFVSEDDGIRSVNSSEAIKLPGAMKLKRVCYVHKKQPRFHRVLCYLYQDAAGSDYAPKAFVQYYFDNGRIVPVPLAKATELRTLPSTKEQIRSFHKAVGPNAIKVCSKRKSRRLDGHFHSK